MGDLDIISSNEYLVHANWLNIFLEIYVKFRAKEIYVACRIFTARVIFLLIFFFTLFSKRNTFFL